MSIVTEMLRDIPIPKMARVRQRFSATEVQDVAQTLREQIRRPDIMARIKKGMRIAVTVGSRGMAEIPFIVRIVIEELKSCQADPFIVPAMGSHGGACAEGQMEVLANLGITEHSAGCPIVSTMDVVELGTLSNGLPVVVDKAAFEADAVVVINRIKPHTAFSGYVESGLTKMIAIGLGKQKGADACHSFGYQRMADHIVESARIKLAKMPFLFGIGTVENAYDRIARIVVVNPEEMIETDAKLLVEAKKNLPRILFPDIDVLVVDYLGKEFSGGGMDANITGRTATDYVRPAVQPPARMVVLDVTDRSHGNTCGMGLADFTTLRLFNKIDFDVTYANILTSTTIASGRIPLIMETDRLAIQGAIKTCNSPDLSLIRMIRIPNSLHLEEIRISEVLLPEAEQCKDISILARPEDMEFDEQGNLKDKGFSRNCH